MFWLATTVGSTKRLKGAGADRGQEMDGTKAELGIARALGGTLLFCVWYLAVVLSDIFLLGRTSAHHLGDYSGLYSLGIGWIEGSPYIQFPWPLWAFGQISALVALAYDYPLASLDDFYAAWAFLNLATAGVAGWLTARLVQQYGAPIWSCLVLGAIAATMPAATTGWNHSNPYMPLGALLVPGTLALVFSFSHGRSSPMSVAERVSLAAVGFAVASNFAVAIVPIAACLAAIAGRPADVLPRLRRGPKRPLLGRLVVAGGGALLCGSFTVYIARALFGEGLDREVALVTVAAAGSAILLVQSRLACPPDDLVGPIAAVLIGWAIGVNVLALEFVPAALGATGTSSAPSRFGIELLPSFEPSLIGEAEIWHFLGLAALVGGAALLVAGVVFRREPRGPLLRGAGVFAVVVAYLNAVVTGWPLAFPVPHTPEQFGINNRYLWLLCTAAVAVAGAILTLRDVRLAKAATALLVLGICGGALAQSVQAKRVIVAIIENTISETDAAIDGHLAADPDNVVLVANAYYPPRAQILYAYHNSLLGVPQEALEEVQEGRVRYIGRFGGSLWRSPIDLIEENGLRPENVMIIAETAEYPRFIVVERAFAVTNTVIARLAYDPAANVPRAPIRPGLDSE